MAQQKRREHPLITILTIMELIFHSSVRSIRKSHSNALIGLLMNVIQTVLLVAVFFIVFSVVGGGAAAIRGDYLLFLLSGIFVYMCHIKVLSAVVGSEGPASPMMKHAPMNTIVAIGAAALGELYIQTLSLAVVLLLYHTAWTPLEIYQPVGFFGMVFLGWFSGLAVGMVLLSLKPWMPQSVKLFTQLYSRLNMFASGKMFAANSLPAFMLPYFTWNPLFHIVDQGRGYAFINYTPYQSSLTYPIYVSLILLMIGLMGEFYTRQRASASWEAKL
ncbi:ABC transporter permease [Roseicitreum antarcticum]|uniref:ABC-type polysaccharide/polyol phosphate export permease n=1 Tax=Roseicitreum antarcticum TaxID=564137 RepID=A0A1H2RDC6_9RHOB|nr:ABC transporter permease [Roseicitreum antarcticum]SDW17476.1 ABC-type polysaccharide/polyol phosphate export permease [Roseicitreum antarcticum]